MIRNQLISMKSLLFLPTAALALAALVHCGPPPMPKGPAPEYEEPPTPSWLKAADAGAPDAAPPQ